MSSIDNLRRIKWKPWWRFAKHCACLHNCLVSPNKVLSSNCLLQTLLRIYTFAGSHANNCTFHPISLHPKIPLLTWKQLCSKNGKDQHDIAKASKQQFEEGMEIMWQGGKKMQKQVFPHDCTHFESLKCLQIQNISAYLSSDLLLPKQLIHWTDNTILEYL